VCSVELRGLVKPAISRAIFSGHPHAQTPPKHLKRNVAIKGKAMVMNVTVEIDPSEKAIMDCDAIYNAFDTLITCDGFVGDNILKQKGQTILSWDWAIVEVGQFKIPAPIHSSSASCSILYDHMDRSVELSNPECASVTAIYYLDMLRRMAVEWDRLGDLLPITARCSIDPGVQWVKSLPSAQFQGIMFALKSTLSEKGHQFLN
jgi:hypothetical protein